MIEQTIYRIIDWLTARSGESLDEQGQYTPMGIVWAIIALVVCLAILRAFGVI